MTVKRIHVEILAGNCGDATEDEVARYALCVEERLGEIYPRATVEAEVVNAGGYSNGASVDGSRWSPEAETVNAVVEEVWKEGAFWDTGSGD